MSLISDERAEELLANEKEKNAEIERLERKVSDLTRDCIYGHNAEIERLSARCAFMASNDYVYSLTSEIERLKVLLNRAASSLVIWASKDSFAAQDLIAELRKAGR